MITEPDGQWHFQSLRLFLSHTHQHRQTMADLKEALSVYAIDAFVAHNDIEPTAQWQEVIEQALRTGDALAAYVTSEFHSSSWTDQEVGAYVGRSKLVVPIRAGADPYGFIAKFQAVNANGKDSQTLAQELFQLLQTHHSTEALMAAAIVDQFATSSSSKGARANLKLIQQIPAQLWTPEMRQHVLTACEDNDQLEAWWNGRLVRDEALRVVSTGLAHG